jgi:hypothetical protein
VFIQGLWKKQCLWTLHQTENLNTSAGSSTKSSSLPSSQFFILRWHRYLLVLYFQHLQCSLLIRSKQKLGFCTE